MKTEEGTVERKGLEEQDVDTMEAQSEAKQLRQ